MRRLMLTLLVFTGVNSFAQETADCQPLVVDVKAGTINGVKGTASMAEVKSALPCYTGDSEEGGPFNCGGGVFYLNHDFYAYTGNDYWEVRKNFKGTVSEVILGATYSVVKSGYGKAVKKVKSGETVRYVHKTSYGCIVFVVTNGTIENFSMHWKPAKEAKICL